MANTPSNNRPQGSGFTNLSKILFANRNNRLGQTLNSGINDTIQNAQDSLSSSENAFNTDYSTAQSNRTSTAEGLNGVFSTVDSLQGADRQASPDRPATDDQPLSTDDVNKYNAAKTFAYSGPNQLNNEDNLFNQANEAQSIGNMTSSVGGRAELLRKYIGGNPNYTNTNQKMDSLFLGNNNHDLHAAKKNVFGLADKVNRDVQNFRDLASQEKNQVQALNTLANNGVADRVKNLNDTLGTRATTYQGQQNTDYTAAKDRFATNHLSDTDRSGLLGQTGPGYDTWGVDASQFIDPVQAPDKGSVADLAERAKIKALNQLAGVDAVGIDPNARTYDPANPYSVRSDDFKKTVDAAKQSYNDDLNGTYYNPGSLYAAINARGKGNAPMSEQEAADFLKTVNKAYVPSYSQNAPGLGNSPGVGLDQYLTDSQKQLDSLLSDIKKTGTPASADSRVVQLQKNIDEATLLRHIIGVAHKQGTYL
jgi:hypothetical protein